VAVTTATGKTMEVDDLPISLMAAPVQLGRRVGRSRRIVTSRFRGFDDDFDMPPLPESIADGQGRAPATQTQDLFVSQRQYSEPVQNSPESVTRRTRSSRKRTLDPPIQEDDEDVLDQLAPAATNLKRRRLADELARKRRGDPSPPPPVLAEPAAKNLTRKSKKIKPEIDVMEVARQRREKEEEMARAEREALQEAMDGMDIEQIRNLAIIEEMDVKRFAPPPGADAHGDEGERWDDRWNGRKNFKKFRRRGEGEPRVLHKVIVPLEEVKKRDFGIGDEYWLEVDKDTTKKKKSKVRTRETQSQFIDVSQSQAPPAQKQSQEVQVAEESGNVDPPTPSQRATRSQKLSDNRNTSPIRPSQKRAPEPMTQLPPAKKARQAPRRHDSDSDDGLGFRFRKKK
jgi:nibrin